MKYDNKELIQALEIFAEDYIAELSNQLRKLDKKASGNLLKSLDTRIIKTAMGTKYTIQILGEDYIKYVDEGRRKNSTPPPVNPTGKSYGIKKWCQYKGIPEGAAYAIAKRIGKRGIKATNVIDKTLKKVTSGKSYRNLEDNVTDWVDDIVDQLLFDLSKNKNITVK